jgi:AAA domain-containing protein
MAADKEHAIKRIRQTMENLGLTLADLTPASQKPVGNPLELFETKSYFESLGPMQWLIECIAQVEEVTWLGALPKHSKTWFLLCVVKALLSGENLFDDFRFKVPVKSTRVIYLIPEVGARSLYKRLRLLGLDQYIYDPQENPQGRLLIRSLSKGKRVELIDELLLSLVEGADVFLDTAIRWIEGDENNSSDVKILTQNIMNLLTRKARSIWCAHHAPKGFEQKDSMTLSNMFRGSGEYGAALSNAYGLSKLDKVANKIHVSCIEARDLDEIVPDFHLQPKKDEDGKTRGFEVVNADAGEYADHKPAKEKSGRKARVFTDAELDRVGTILQSTTAVLSSRKLAEALGLPESSRATADNMRAAWEVREKSRTQMRIPIDLPGMSDGVPDF